MSQVNKTILTVIKKLKHGQQITGYIVENKSKQKAYVTQQRLKDLIRSGEVILQNMTLTSDNKLVEQTRGHRQKQSKTTQKQRAIEFFESLSAGEPFTFMIKNVGNWKQAVFCEERNGVFYFYDLNAMGAAQGFQRTYLENQTALEFRKDDNDPIEVAKIIQALENRK